MPHSFPTLRSSGLLGARYWTSPGFEQSGNDPVVCVSWEDANAYARWLAQRSDHAYRLPHARESAMLPAAKSERQVSSWNSDCSGNCSRRIGSGPSWRGDAGTRPLDAARGYADVRSEEHTSELQSLMRS